MWLLKIGALAQHVDDKTKQKFIFIFIYIYIWHTTRRGPTPLIISNLMFGLSIEKNIVKSNSHAYTFSK